MFKPMPSPRGTNREGLYVPARFVPSPVVAAYDAVTGLAPRKPAAPASAPRKPAADASREEGLKAILEFLAGHLSDELYPVVEEELRRTVLGSTSAPQPAADRRRRMGADSASAKDFGARFPGARRIGFA